MFLSKAQFLVQFHGLHLCEEDLVKADSRTKTFVLIVIYTFESYEFSRKLEHLDSVFDEQRRKAAVGSCTLTANWTFDSIWARPVAHIAF